MLTLTYLYEPFSMQTHAQSLDQPHNARGYAEEVLSILKVKRTAALVTRIMTYVATQIKFTSGVQMERRSFFRFLLSSV